MTTPIQTPAPAQPVNPDNMSARDFFNQDDATLAAAMGVSAPAEAAPEAPSPRAIPPEDPNRVEIPREEPETVPTESEGWEGKANGEPAPEGELKVLERKPMTEFAILDEQGELEIPDVKIRFKAKGEERELPLDHVVRLAQFGFANEEREQQVMAARRFVAEAQQTQTTLQQQIQQYEQSYDRLFNDPGFYEAARLEYLQQNTPEARAQRAESQVHAIRQQQLAQQEDQQITAFVQQNLVPTVQTLLTNNPSVNEHEVLGRYTELTAPLLVNGRIPLNRLAYVQRLVSEDLASWVERQHYERQLKQTQAAQAATRQTQETATAKRQAARVFAHQGAPGGNQPAKPTQYKTAADWLNSTFGTND